MATEHRFDPYGDQAEVEKRPRSWLSTCLIGCLVTAVVGLILFGIVAYWVSQNWRGWLSDLSTAVLNEQIDSLELPPQEKQEIKIEVQRPIDALREDRLSGEQAKLIAKMLDESPLWTMIDLSTADRQFFEKSGLSEEEKAEGRVTLQRFLRGAIDGTIDKDSVDTAMAHVADRQPGGGWELRNRVTDEQLRSFLTAAKEEADEANIPAEPPDFDPSNEVKRFLDEALNEPAEAPTKPPEAADEPPEAPGEPAEAPSEPAEAPIQE